MKLKDRLSRAGATHKKIKKLRKMELIRLLIEIDERNEGYIVSKKDTNQALTHSEPVTSSQTESCIFLILDENLHRFPFEGMKALTARSICRIPCLSFVLATLRERKISNGNLPYVDLTKVSYILDPENNLQPTKNRILPVIQRLSSGRGWEGVVGTPPSASMFTGSLGQNNGLMIYFGHGGAQVCFSRRRVEDLIDSRMSNHFKTKKNNSPCNAAVILMGCSSGRLVSINRKTSKLTKQLPLYYEPEGIALSYLCAGAPCVIGNLWDVTDNDIDRFSVSLLKSFFKSFYNESTNSKGSRNLSLAQCVAASRSACKLKYLVGCAPVCYGVPTFISKTSSSHQL